MLVGRKHQNKKKIEKNCLKINCFRKINGKTLKKFRE